MNNALHADPAQLRAMIDLLLSDAAARERSVPLHHAPESLTRAPAKVEILVNSLLVFLARGTSDVTVQDLLDAAGISRRTFYKYFRNKVDVLESLYKLSTDIMVVRFKSDVGQAQTVADAAARMVAVYFGYHRDLGPVIRLMQEEAVRSDSPLMPHRVAGMANVVGLVNAEVRRISGREIDPLVIQSLLWAMESLSLDLLRNGAPPPEAITHAGAVVSMMAQAAFERALSDSR